jgi:hypothetical protein
MPAVNSSHEGACAARVGSVQARGGFGLGTDCLRKQIREEKASAAVGAEPTFGLQSLAAEYGNLTATIRSKVVGMTGFEPATP